MSRGSLGWFRRKQRALTRGVLALFCLAWLQLAAMPCVMADGMQPAPVSDSSAGHEPGHCEYCPPPPPVDHCTPDQAPAVCAYPDGPQVDVRVTVASALALPALAPVFTLPPLAPPARVVAASITTAPPVGPSLPVSYCRFLK